MTQETKPLSIIVPTLNEAGNLPSLFKRIGVSLNAAQIPYEIVLVDDHSSDDTLAVAKAAASEYPIRIFTKRGERGKAYSLLEGFDYAAYELVCMIDADLQYPPEAIAPMYEQLAELEADVVITERVEQHTSFLRQLSSKVFNLIFTRALFGIQYDTQSGLKLFKKRVLNGMSLNPSPWSFDLEFIVRSLEREYKIINYEIPFQKRFAGEAKIHLFQTALELSKASLKLRRDTSIKRVRFSYKQNLEFTRGMVIAVGAFATLLLAIGGSTHSASALSVSSLPATVSQTLQSAPITTSADLLSSVGKDLGVGQPPSTSSNAASTPVSSVTSPLKSTSNSLGTTAQSATKATTDTAGTTGTSAASSNPTASVSATSSSTPVSISSTGAVSAAKLVPVAFATSSTAITPVTIPAQAALNSDTDNVNDYKNASLSYRDKWLLQHIAQRILEIGGGLTVLGVILLVVVKQKSNYHGSRVLAKE